MEDRLNLAIKNIKSGDKETGKQLLMEVLNAEPENDKAWVWMSAVVETDDLRRECLEEALMFNPFNETAKRGLAKLKAGHPKTTKNDNGRGPTIQNSQSHPSPSNQENWTHQPLIPQPLPQPDGFQHEHAAQDNATTYTIKELARFTNKKEIATKLAVTGMNYHEALNFVNEVERTKRREIELRRLPLVVAICGILTFMGGVWSLSIIWDIAEGYVPSIWAFVFGIPMFFSGVVGLIVSVRKIMKGNDP